MGEAVLQLNIPDKIDYIRRPYCLFQREINGRKPCRSVLTIAGAISSFSMGAAKSCGYSYSAFQNKFGYSRATVAHAIAELKKSGEIAQSKRKSGAVYHYEGENSGAYITTEIWLYHTLFRIGSKERYLRNSEIDVLSLMMTHANNPNGAGTYRGSFRMIEGILSLSHHTVHKAISALLEAGLIFRAAEDKGVNGHKMSVYRINAKLIRRSKKAYKKAQERQNAPKDYRNEQEKAADARAEMARYYAIRQDERQRRIEHFKGLLESDGEYVRVQKEIRRLDIEIAKAEVFNLGTIAQLRAEMRQKEAIRARRMAALNVSEKDLNPPYYCVECHDTGERIADHRMCDCWRIQR